MKSNEQYLTLYEYQRLGGKLKDESSFDLLEYEARKKLDLRTLRRLTNLEEQPEEVKICMFNLINKIQSIQEKRSKTNENLSSESVGGYSVSFASIKDIVNSNETELNTIIEYNLFGLVVNGEHVLYLGVK